MLSSLLSHSHTYKFGLFTLSRDEFSLQSRGNQYQTVQLTSFEMPAYKQVFAMSTALSHSMLEAAIILTVICILI